MPLLRVPMPYRQVNESPSTCARAMLGLMTSAVCKDGWEKAHFRDSYQKNHKHVIVRPLFKRFSRRIAQLPHLEPTLSVLEQRMIRVRRYFVYSRACQLLAMNTSRVNIPLCRIEKSWKSSHQIPKVSGLPLRLFPKTLATRKPWPPDFASLLLHA